MIKSPTEDRATRHTIFRRREAATKPRRGRNDAAGKPQGGRNEAARKPPGSREETEGKPQGSRREAARKLQRVREETAMKPLVVEAGPSNNIAICNMFRRGEGGNQVSGGYRIFGSPELSRA